jgi:hypothetical protein
MYDVIIEKCGSGKYELKAVAAVTADGINVYVGGGEKSHIGSIAVSQPRSSLKGDGSMSCTTSVFNVLGHKDDGIAVPMAEDICRRTGMAVVVTAGIHVDDATSDDIHILKKNGTQLIERILNRISF